jgi:hypothetical protein
MSGGYDGASLLHLTCFPQSRSGNDERHVKL